LFYRDGEREINGGGKKLQAKKMKRNKINKNSKKKEPSRFKFLLVAKGQ
jgi:hypothetical protein